MSASMNSILAKVTLLYESDLLLLTAINLLKKVTSKEIRKCSVGRCSQLFSRVNGTTLYYCLECTCCTPGCLRKKYAGTNLCIRCTKTAMQVARHAIHPPTPILIYDDCCRQFRLDKKMCEYWNSCRRCKKCPRCCKCGSRRKMRCWASYTSSSSDTD